jgi:hypothetical protein
MTERKFHKTIFTVVVLSEDPLDQPSLADLAYEIDQGVCVGSCIKLGSEVLDGERAARELEGVGSEPGFFQLDADGADLGEDEFVSAHKKAVNEIVCGRVIADLDAYEATNAPFEPPPFTKNKYVLEREGPLEAPAGS